MPRAKPRDHLGNRYPTVRDMCRAYGISTATFYAALEEGATLEEALTRLSGIRTKMPVRK